MGLTIKQKAFAEYYIKLGNATESYIKAGYKASKREVAEANARKLLGKDSVKKYIKEKKYIENRRFICSTCSKALIFLCFQGLDGGTDVDRSSLASSPLTCSRTSGYSESGFMEY